MIWQIFPISPFAMSINETTYYLNFGLNWIEGHQLTSPYPESVKNIAFILIYKLSSQFFTTIYGLVNGVPYPPDQQIGERLAYTEHGKI